MAQFVAAALVAAESSALVTAGFVIGGNAALINGVLLFAGSLALSSYQKRKAQRKQREAYNAAQVDRLANVDSTVSPRELVLGRVRKGGQVIFRGSTGTNNAKFLVAIELAFHECDAIEQVYLNDVAVTLDGNGYVQTAPYALTRTTSASATVTGPTTTLPQTPVAGSVSVVSTDSEGSSYQVPFTVAGAVVTCGQIGATINYQYTSVESKARIWWYLGSPDQQADPRLQQLFPSQWTAAHRARGVTYLIAEFDYDETAFPSGPPTITVVMRGAKVFDPRTGLTAWSENPALLMRHVYTHPFFGAKTPNAAEDLRIIAAANACDTTAGYVVDGVTTTRPLFTAGLVLPFGTAARDGLDDLAQAMGGSWAYGRGELFVKAGVYSAPVMSLGEADLAVEVRAAGASQPEQQPISVNVHRARNDKFNVANVRIWDAAQGYKESALTPLKAAALIARDAAELPREIPMAAVGYAPQALHVAGIAMRDERDALTVVLPFKLKAYAAEMFDGIYLTLPRYGWTAKEFMVVGRRWLLGNLVELTLKETGPAIYQMDAAFQPQGYAANTSLPAPWEIDPPSTLVIASGTDELVVQAGAIRTRVRVSWPAIENAAVVDGGQVEVQYRNVRGTDWLSVTVQGGETEAILTEVSDGEIIVVRARTRTRLAVSDWSLQQYHEVVGQTERPAAPAGFSVVASGGFALASWQLHPAPDVRYGGQIVVRHSPATTGATWETSYVLEVFDGNSTTGTVSLITGTYLVKAVDAAGNWSQTPSTFVATEGMVTGFTTVATSTQDPAFAGAKTSVVAVDGLLKLDAATPIDSVLDLIDTWGPIDALGGVAAEGLYDFDAYVDLGTQAVRRFEVDLSVFAYDAADLIDSRDALIDTWPSIDGAEVNDCDCTVYAATTNDDPAGAPVWSAWTPFMVADFNCRAAKFRARLSSGFITHALQVDQLRVHVKV